MNQYMYFLKQSTQYLRKAGPDGSVDSSKVSSIMKSIGQNPSEAEIQVK